MSLARPSGPTKKVLPARPGMPRKFGCIDKRAANYDIFATDDDGTCLTQEEFDLFAELFKDTLSKDELMMYMTNAWQRLDNHHWTLTQLWNIITDDIAKMKRGGFGLRENEAFGRFVPDRHKTAQMYGQMLEERREKHNREREMELKSKYGILGAEVIGAAFNTH